jgi:protein-S-isoprenylcysteine O-methyltransferase
MTLSISVVPTLLGLAYILSEIGLGLKKRAKSSESQAADQGSLRLLWIVIVVSVTLAFTVAPLLPAADMGSSTVASAIGAGVFVLGLALRWYSIIHLGRFFTVNVAIAADHRLIDTGPYGLIRHPSYTGALLAFLGLAISIGNWASVVVMMVPVFLVFLRRMHVEEDALLEALPDAYPGYMRRTKRLIPAVY